MEKLVEKTGELTVKDFRGIDVRAGDEIAYPGRSGSSLWMNCGTVTEVIRTGQDWRGNPQFAVKVRRHDKGGVNSRVVRVYCTDRIAKL